MKLKLLIICLIISFLPGIIGSIFTQDNVKSDWYESNKPSFTPPNYVFPIAWTTLYILIGLSMYFVLNKNNKKRNLIIKIFAINLILNTLWTPLFFALKQPLISLIEIYILILSTLLLITLTYKVSKASSYLLIPYLLWLIFASFLNLAFI